MQTDDQIKLAFKLIGDAAAEGSAPADGPDAASKLRQRQRRHKLWSTAALAAGAAVVAGLLSLPFWADGANGSPEAANRGARDKLSWAGTIACSQVIAEGNVVSVRDARQAGRVILTFAVDDWLWPAKGKKRVSLDVPDPAAQGAYERWKPGEHLLITVSKFPDQLVSDYRGSQITRVRSQIEPELAKAVGKSCSLTGTDQDANK
ncbi:hypothetical protein ACFUNF_33275 [Streptomyces sp. NPDC057291]|uniref:hypothetical protein n=1 Tax=Streptomyces sp. NPDC057291 TaxID=3346087 RepID=UPI00362A760C